MNSKNQEDVTELNKYLQGEISAVEAYEKCIQEVGNPALISQLRVLKSSHQRRVELLNARIVSLDGLPVSESGGLGQCASIVQKGATVFGDKASVSALEKGEVFGLELYEKGMDKLSESEKVFVKEDLFPEQRRSHDILREIEMKL